jgi:homospermidine synthase
MKTEEEVRDWLEQAEDYMEEIRSSQKTAGMIFNSGVIAALKWALEEEDSYVGN